MLAQEYCCGDLSHIIGSATQRFPEAVVKGIMQQVLRGLAAVHQAGGGRGVGVGRGGQLGWKPFVQLVLRGCWSYFKQVGEGVATWPNQSWPFAQHLSHPVV